MILVDSANGRNLKVYQSLGSVGKNIKGSASCYRLILALILCCLIQIVMILILPVHRLLVWCSQTLPLQARGGSGCARLTGCTVTAWILDYMDWKRPYNGMLRPFYGPFST